MSRKQRRDHDPVIGALEDGSVGCMTCGEHLDYVDVVGYDRSLPVSKRRTIKTYWRHRRRWHVRPA